MSFSFQFCGERLNWQLLVAIDLQRVIRDVDVHALQGVIENIACAKITRDEVQLFQPDHTVHLLTLCQLILQYLIYTQQYLTRQLDETKKESEKYASKVQELLAENATAKAETKGARRELKRVQQMAQLWEQWIAQKGALESVGAAQQQPQVEPPATLPCPTCGRMFSSQERLSAHAPRCQSKTESTKAMSELRKDMEKWHADQAKQQADLINALKESVTNAVQSSRQHHPTDTPLALQLQQLQRENDALRQANNHRDIQEVKDGLTQLRTFFESAVLTGTLGKSSSSEKHRSSSSSRKKESAVSPTSTKSTASTRDDTAHKLPQAPSRPPRPTQPAAPAQPAPTQTAAPAVPAQTAAAEQQAVPAPPAQPAAAPAQTATPAAPAPPAQPVQPAAPAQPG
eukprot:PhM_4_TR3550/c0_g1_i1/m.67870